jgi:hypothetical protein
MKKVSIVCKFSGSRCGARDAIIDRVFPGRAAALAVLRDGIPPDYSEIVEIDRSHRWAIGKNRFKAFRDGLNTTIYQARA